MIGGTRFRLDAEIARQMRLAGEIARAQTDISSEKRLQVASDDPIASARVADIRRMQANEATWATNVQISASLAAGVDTALDDIGTAIDRAKELMLTGTNQTTSDKDRLAAAAELRSLAGLIGSISNLTDTRGQKLFPTAVLQVPVGPGTSVAPTASRDEVFTINTAGGPRDLVALLQSAAAAIEIADPAARATAGTVSLGEVTAAASHLLIQRTNQGTRGSWLDSLRDRFTDSSLTLDEQRSTLEATNISETVTRLQAKLLSLEASQAAFARLGQLSLFDLLR